MHWMRAMKGMLWPALLLALLIAMAGLQYRWTGQVSDAESERLRSSLASSVRRFARDVDEVAVTFLRAFRIEARGPGTSFETFSKSAVRPIEPRRLILRSWIVSTS